MTLLTSRERRYAVIPAMRNFGVSRLRGPANELHRPRAFFGWTPVRNAAEEREETREGSDLVSRLRALQHSADQIERDIFLDELMKHLTIPGRLVYRGENGRATPVKRSPESAELVGSVDVVFTRIKQRFDGLPVYWSSVRINCSHG
jgi:hypothetical protein